MKWKSAITIMIISTFLGFAVMIAVLLSILEVGFAKYIQNVLNTPIEQALYIIMAGFFLFSFIVSMSLTHKVGNLDNIQTQAEELEKEKERYKSATDAFVKMHKIQSADLL